MMKKKKIKRNDWANTTKEERRRIKALMLGAGAGLAGKVVDGVMRVETTDEKEKDGTRSFPEHAS
jgi:heme/copper-type cytochrome/quinol oxidase subunit 1